MYHKNKELVVWVDSNQSCCYYYSTLLASRACSRATTLASSTGRARRVFWPVAALSVAKVFQYYTHQLMMTRPFF